MVGLDRRWPNSAVRLESADMLSALLRAIAQLSEPSLRRIVGLSLALALASFIVLWIAVGFVLAQHASFGWSPLDWLVDLLGAGAVLALSWLLFPAVVTMVIGFFVEPIAGAIEALDYPGRGPPRRASISETIITTLRLMGLT